jgi:hypothetical protein
MIALINDGLATGKLKLTHRDLEDFLKYTQSQNRQTA